MSDGKGSDGVGSVLSNCTPHRAVIREAERGDWEIRTGRFGLGTRARSTARGTALCWSYPRCRILPIALCMRLGLISSEVALNASWSSHSNPLVVSVSTASRNVSSHEGFFGFHSASLLGGTTEWSKSFSHPDRSSRNVECERAVFVGGIAAGRRGGSAADTDTPPGMGSESGNVPLVGLVDRNSNNFTKIREDFVHHIDTHASSTCAWHHERFRRAFPSRGSRAP
jgi:hypothetical protein